MIVSRLIIPLLFVLLSCTLSFAKCPIDTLNVNVITGKGLDKKKVYAEIKDKLGINKAELKKIGEGVYHGELNFVTDSFVFFVNFGCSYFPKYLKIYFNDNLVNKIKLNKKKLRRHEVNNAVIRDIYEVNVFLEDKTKQK